MSESTPPTSPPPSPVPEAPSAAVPPAPTGVGNRATPISPTSNGTEPDWTDQVTDLIVDVVDRVRDRTTGPILKIARGVVYGIVAVVVAVPVFVIGTIFLGRLLELIPGPIWIPYAVLGLLLVTTGLILWQKRRPRDV